MLKTNMHITASNVGQKIKAARLRAGISQQELGEEVFKTGAAIGYIERGKRGINVEDLALFAEKLNVPITFFFNSEVSDEQLLQETLEKLQKHIAKLNQTINNQSKIIDELILKLPSTTELRLISESSIDPILLINANGKILYATKSISELIGINSKQIIGKTCEEFVIPEKIAEYKQMLASVIAGKKITDYETRVLDINEKITDIGINAQVIKKDKQKVAHIVIRNINQKKAVERALEENKEKYKQFLKQSSDGIYVAKKDATVVEWNPALEKITGIEKANAIGKKTWDLLVASNFTKTSKYESKTYSSLVRTEVFSKDSESKNVSRRMSFKNAKGEKIAAHVNFFPIILGEKEYIGGIVRDITQIIKNQDKVKLQQ